MDIRLNGSLKIEFARWERFWAFGPGIELRRDQIVAVRFHPVYEDPGRAWRTFGSSIPRTLYAGRFRRRGRRELWLIRKPRGMFRFRAEDVLEIETNVAVTRVLVSTSLYQGQRVIEWFERDAG